MVVLGLDGNCGECSACELKPPPLAKRKTTPEQEAATSTTPTETLLSSNVQIAVLNKIPTQEWGIEEVIQYIKSEDKRLGDHAELFRRHVSYVVMI